VRHGEQGGCIDIIVMCKPMPPSFFFFSPIEQSSSALALKAHGTSAIEIRRPRYLGEASVLIFR